MADCHPLPPSCCLTVERGGQPQEQVKKPWPLAFDVLHCGLTTPDSPVLHYHHIFWFSATSLWPGNGTEPSLSSLGHMCPQHLVPLPPRVGVCNRPPKLKTRSELGDT